jgi:hypothetical protein
VGSLSLWITEQHLEAQPDLLLPVLFQGFSGTGFFGFLFCLQPTFPFTFRISGFVVG